MEPKARSGLRTAIVVLGLLGIGAAAWFGLRSKGEGSGASGSLWTVARSPLRVTVREGGSLEPLESYTVVSEVEGQSAIVSIVPEGTIITDEDVSAGLVLVQLDAKDLKEKLRAQQIQLREAEAASQTARSSLAIIRQEDASLIRQAELNQRFALVDLKRYVGEILADELLPHAPTALEPVGDGGARPAEPPPAPAVAEVERRIRALLGIRDDDLLEPDARLRGEALQTVREMNGDIRLAGEELKRAKDKWDWSQRLREKTFVSREEEEADRIAHERAQETLAKAKTAALQYATYDFPKEVEKLLSGVVEAEDKLARTKESARSAEAKAESDLRAREAQESLQGERLKAYEEQLEKSVIKATKPGLVVYASSRGDHGYGNDRPIQQGTQVGERQPIITIPDPGTLGAVVNVHESVIEKVEKGQPVTVFVDALAGVALKGTVRKKATLPNQNDRWMNPDLKVYATQVQLIERHPALQPGMSVRVEIEVAVLPDVLAVPLQAVAGSAGRSVVYVSTADGEVERPVTLGLANDAFVEVKSGLAEGDKILLAPPRRQAPAESPRGEGSEKREGGSPGETRPADPGAAPASPPSPSASGSPSPGGTPPDGSTPPAGGRGRSRGSRGR